jgi:hypothetical protein
MVQWASPEYEEKIIAGFEKSWEDIQRAWFSIDETRSEAGDTQLCTLLEEFSGYFNEVYEDGDLAEGSASFLFLRWYPVNERTEQCRKATPGKLVLRRLGTFSILLKDFKNKEPVYDAIRAYCGSTV